MRQVPPVCGPDGPSGGAVAGGAAASDVAAGGGCSGPFVPGAGPVSATFVTQALSIPRPSSCASCGIGGGGGMRFLIFSMTVEVLLW